MPRIPVGVDRDGRDHERDQPEGANQAAQGVSDDPRRAHLINDPVRGIDQAGLKEVAND